MVMIMTKTNGIDPELRDSESAVAMDAQIREALAADEADDEEPDDEEEDDEEEDEDDGNSDGYSE
jgi:hypothetical protein